MTQKRSEKGRATSTHGLIFILVALLLFSIVTTASATSQSWYLTDNSIGVPLGTDYFMDKGSGAGTANVTMGSLFVANEPAAETCDMSGTWTTHIVCDIGGGTNYGIADIVIIEPEGDQRVVASSGWAQLSNEYVFNADIPTSDFEIKPGEYLAFRFSLSFGIETDKIAVTNGESYISSPDTDPGYPVPELGTCFLFSVGLLALAGYVWVRRRN